MSTRDRRRPKAARASRMSTSRSARPRTATKVLPTRTRLSRRGRSRPRRQEDDVGRLEVIVLALLAALCAAVGIVLRQRATTAVPAAEGSSGTLVATVMRDPWWWSGTAVAVAGYVCQALALSRGSLLLVQPLLMSSLLFALPIGARVAHRRLTGREWGWAVVLTVGLAVFVVVGHPREGHNR